MTDGGARPPLVSLFDSTVAGDALLVTKALLARELGDEAELATVLTDLTTNPGDGASR